MLFRSDESGELFTWKVSTTEFRFGMNFGFWGFGIAISWDSEDVKIGGYLEEGFSIGGTVFGMGFL